MPMISNNKNIYVIEAVYDDDKKDIENENVNKTLGTSFDDAIDKTGFGKLSIGIIFICSLVVLAIINETMGVMYLMPAAQCDLHLTPTKKGVLSAVGFIGILVSSQLWGYIADTKGRRKVICYTIFVANICTVISSLLEHFWPFVVFRFLSGFFISGCSATIFAYLGEFNSSKYCSTIIAYACVAIGLGTLYVPVTASLILPGTWSIHLYSGLYLRPWRLLLLINSFPAFFGAIGIFFLKESPKFYLAQGREDEALDVMKWVYQHNTGKHPDTFPVQKIVPEINADYKQNLKLTGRFSTIISMWNQTVPLVRPPYVVKFLTCAILQLFAYMVASGMGLWYAEISNRLQSSIITDSSICTVITMKPQHINVSLELLGNSTIVECNDTINQQTFIDGIVVGAANTIGFIILANIIKYVKNSTLLLILFILSGTCGITLQLMTDSVTIIVFFSGFLIFAGLCMSILNAIAVELFPTHLRGMAVCILLMCARCGSILGTNLVGNFLESYCELMFYSSTGIIFLCGCLTYIARN